MYKKNSTSWLKHWDFILVDLLSLILSYYVAFETRFPELPGPYSIDLYRSLGIAIVIISFAAILMTNNLSGVVRRDIYGEIKSVLVLSVVCIALVILYLYSLHKAEYYSRLLLFYTYLYFLFIDVLARTVWKKFVVKRLKHKTKVGVKGRATIVVCDSKHVNEIISDIREDFLSGFTIRGVVLTDDDDMDCVCDVPVVAKISEATEFICRNWIDEVFVYVSNETTEVKLLFEHCAEMGVTVHQVMITEAIDERKQFVERVGNHTVLTTAYSFIAPYQAFIKRVVDIVGGLVGSIITIAIGIVIGPIIYIKSPGPIIFKQKRIGRNGRQFYVLKFRSMYLDAEDRKKELLSENRVSDGMMFKIEHDPRIIGNRQLEDGTWKTGIGEFIRKTSLDEFPQFINVLKGEMSLVGTRPPTVDEWEKYQYHHRARLAVKPGITGLWQVSGRSEITDFEEVVKLDTKYINTFRLSNDLKILFKTILVLFDRKGAM